MCLFQAYDTQFTSSLIVVKDFYRQIGCKVITNLLSHSVVMNRTIKIFGRTLSRARIDAGLTQQEAAQRAGVSLSRYTSLESAEISSVFLRMRRKLAGMIGISEAEFTERIVAQDPSTSAPRAVGHIQDPLPEIIAAINAEDPVAVVMLEQLTLDQRIAALARAWIDVGKKRRGEIIEGLNHPAMQLTAKDFETGKRPKIAAKHKGK
jgi:transcriptional regulator with XRE-family HTH domain